MNPTRAFRLGWLIALVGLAAWALPARAQVVTVTVLSVDELIDTAKYGLTLAGHEDQANQLDQLAAAYLRTDGLKGLDTKKPWGVYVAKLPPHGEKPRAVLFIPTSGEQDFVAFLDRLNVGPTKEKAGLYSVTIPTGQKFFLKVKGGYAYLCEDEGELQNPVSPSGAALPRGTLFRLRFDAKQIPASVKDEIIKKMDEEIAKEQGKKENEGDHDYQARQWGTRLARGGVERLIRDSQAFDLSLQVDRDKNVAAFEATLVPVAGSPLASEIRDMTKATTHFGGLAESSAAFAFWSGVMNEHVRGDLNKLLDTAFQKGMEKETSVLKKAVAEKVYKVLEPTLKSDVIDFAVALRQGPGSGPMTVVAAARVKNGKQIEQLLKDFADGMPEKQKQAVQFDADKAGDVNIHVVTMPEGDKGAKVVKQVFGAARVAVAFADEAVVAAVGQNAVEEVKHVLADLGKATARPASFQLEFHAKAFTRFEKNEAKRKVFEEAFKAPGSDVIRVAVTGGDRLQFRVQASTHLLKLAKAAQISAE